ncbi:hypothetical protein ABPG75_014033 [Micractinium tetrahymenae]
MEIRKRKKGLQVAFCHGSAEHLVGPPLTASEADLVCDVLAVKVALDAGQPLEGACAAARAAVGDLKLVTGAASELRGLPSSRPGTAAACLLAAEALAGVTRLHR